MKIECSVEKLRSAIQRIDRITGKNLTLPVLETILFIASKNMLTLRATNLSLGVEASVPVKVHKEGTVALDGGLLATLFSAMKSDEMVVMELVEATVAISTKSNTVVLKTFPHDDFPTIPVVSGTVITIDAAKFIDGIRSVYYSAAVSDIKPEISAVYLHGEDGMLLFVATDSFRLAEKRIAMKGAEEVEGILIPFRNIPDIIKIFSDTSGDLVLTISKNQVSIASEGMYLTSRIIDGAFPDYKQIIPKSHETEVVVLKHDLMNTLKVSTVFTDKLNQITLSVKPKEGVFEVGSRNSELGEATSRVDAVLKGDDVEAGFNHRYFLDCFQSIGADSISVGLNGPSRAAIIKGVGDDSFVYLIMPMNR